MMVVIVVSTGSGHNYTSEVGDGNHTWYSVADSEFKSSIKFSISRSDHIICFARKHAYIELFTYI